MATNQPQIRVWLAVIGVMLVLQALMFWFTPPLTVAFSAPDTTMAHVWPYIDVLEYENNDPQQGRAFRWAPMQGVLRIPRTTSAAPVVVSMYVHTARPPEVPAMQMQLHTASATTTFALNPGWRRIAFVTIPNRHEGSYAQLSYSLTGPTLSDRRDLGLAVADVSLRQHQSRQFDPIRWAFVMALWLWVIPLGMVRYRLAWVAAGVIGIGLVVASLIPHWLAYVLPNDWNVVGYLWLFTAIVMLLPWRRAVLSFGWSIIGVTLVIVLWRLDMGWSGVVLLVGIWFFAKPWPDIAWPTPTSDMNRWGWIVLLLVVVCAAVLRIWQLDGYPTGLFRDEARHGGLAWRILAGERMIYSPVANLPAGYFYLSALPIAWFDASAWSIRIVSALMGTVSVAIVYWMLRDWVGSAIALWASVVLATFLWHVGISRIGFPATLGPALTMIAVGSWIRIPNARYPLGWAVLAGAVTGMMLMVYHSARLMPLVVVVSIVIILWQYQWPWRRLLPALFVFGSVALLVASPILWYAMTQPDNYMRRIGVTSIMADAAVRGVPVWLAIFDNIHAYVGMLFVRGDDNPRHFNLGAPQLNLFEAVAFVAGVVWMWQQKHIWLLWLTGWLLVGLISGVLSVDAPHALRTVESIVPIVCIVAIGAYRLSMSIPMRWRLIVLVGVLCLNTVWSTTEYRAWQVHPRTQTRFDTIATNDVRFIQQLIRQPPASTTFVYVPDAMRRSDVGIFLLHTSGVRVWQNDTSTFDPNLQHVVLVPVSTVMPADAMLLTALPAEMRDRYQLWCVGDCDDVTWMSVP